MFNKNYTQTELGIAEKKYKVLRENYHAMMRDNRNLSLKERKKLFKTHKIEIEKITSKFKGEFETL